MDMQAARGAHELLREADGRWALRIEGRAAGWARAAGHGATLVPALEVWVDEAYRGRRWADVLVGAAFDWAKDCGCGGATAVIERTNHRAMALMERWGVEYRASRDGEFVFLKRFARPAVAPKDQAVVAHPCGLTIRPFAANDRALVEAFFDQMGGDSRSFFDRGHGNRRYALRFFEEGVETTQYWMATDRVDGLEIMVGYVFLTRVSTNLPELGIALHEGYKGRRLGQVLIEHAADWARRMGMGGITLTVSPANLRGQKLYERCGFVRQGDYLNELAYLYRFAREA